MNNRLSSRQNLTMGFLIVVAIIFPGPVSTRETPHRYSDMTQSENSVNQPQDSLKSAIFLDTGTAVKIFSSVIVDNDNIKWFVTEQGIVSFNGEKWTLHNKNRKVPTQDLKGFALEVNTYGQDLWIASPKGATVATIPVDGKTGATTYHT